MDGCVRLCHSDLRLGAAFTHPDDPLVLPSLILMILISKMFMKYMKTSLVQSVFTGLRPAVVGLLAAATLLLCNEENFSTPKENPWQFFISCALLIATAVGTGYLKINPIRMICYAGIAGLFPIRMICYAGIAGLLLLY